MPSGDTANRVNAIAREDYGGLPDSRVVELCLARDEQAWAQIVARFKRRVFNIAYKFTGRHGDAEDLTQEIFLRLFRCLDKFNRDADFGTWLSSVARNHEDRDRRGFVRHALDRLAPKLREAVVLRDLMEMSYQEMAERLALPEGTVKSRINRGREELARILLKARQDARRAASDGARARGR